MSISTHYFLLILFLLSQLFPSSLSINYFFSLFYSIIYIPKRPSLKVTIMWSPPVPEQSPHEVTISTHSHTSLSLHAYALREPIIPYCIRSTYSSLPPGRYYFTIQTFSQSHLHIQFSLLVKFMFMIWIKPTFIQSLLKTHYVIHLLSCYPFYVIILFLPQHWQRLHTERGSIFQGQYYMLNYYRTLSLKNPLPLCYQMLWQMGVTIDYDLSHGSDRLRLRL